MKPESLEETIRRYRSQLLQYQSRSAPPAERLPAPAPDPEPSAPARIPTPEPPAPEPAPESSPDGVGTLVAAVTTAREALPVAGADVMLSRRDAQGTHLLYFLETDRSGRTPVMQLPAPAASQSESPGSAAPYAVYDLRVFADGYVPAVQTNVRVFGGTAGTIPITLIPAERP